MRVVLLQNNEKKCNSFGVPNLSKAITSLISSSSVLKGNFNASFLNSTRNLQRYLDYIGSNQDISYYVPRASTGSSWSQNLRGLSTFMCTDVSHKTQSRQLTAEFSTWPKFTLEREQHSTGSMLIAFSACKGAQKCDLKKNIISGNCTWCHVSFQCIQPCPKAPYPKLKCPAALFDTELVIEWTS